MYHLRAALSVIFVTDNALARRTKNFLLAPTGKEEK